MGTTTFVLYDNEGFPIRRQPKEPRSMLIKHKNLGPIQLNRGFAANVAIVNMIRDPVTCSEISNYVFVLTVE